MNKLRLACGVLMIAAAAACSSSETTPTGGGSTGGGSTGGGSTGGGSTGGGSTGGGSTAISMPSMPGADSGAINRTTLSQASQAADDLDTAITNNTIDNPTTTPTGNATLHGYVAVDGDPSGDDQVVGNLTVNANFDTGTVTTRATDFEEFTIDMSGNVVPVTPVEITGGTLTGAGTINRTSITSSLDGTVTTTGGPAVVDSDLTGQVLDNAGDLVVFGDLNGTVTIGGTPETIEGGFIASE